MNASEAAVLLAKIAANDGREVTEAAARAWAEALPDVTLQDALDCLPGYYRAATRNSRNWIYPGDVLEGVEALQASRRRSAARAELERRGWAAVSGEVRTWTPPEDAS